MSWEETRAGKEAFLLAISAAALTLSGRPKSLGAVWLFTATSTAEGWDGGSGDSLGVSWLFLTEGKSDEGPMESRGFGRGRGFAAGAASGGSDVAEGSLGDLRSAAGFKEDVLVAGFGALRFSGGAELLVGSESSWPLLSASLVGGAGGLAAIRGAFAALGDALVCEAT